MLLCNCTEQLLFTYKSGKNVYNISEMKMV